MSIEFIETSFHSISDDNNKDYNKGQKLLHICEVCGKQEVLTSEEGFKAGWDYAPFLSKYYM